MSNVSEQYRETVNSRDTQIRESWVRTMELRIVRDALAQCQQAEGVNHYENCKTWATRYMDMLQDSKVKGFRQIDLE